MKILKKMRDESKNLTLHNYIFFVFLSLLLLTSIISIIGNIITNFPAGANIKWLFALFLCLTGYYLLYKNKFLEQYKILLLSAILGLVIFPAWFYGGGDNTITLLYLMLVGIEAFLMLESFILKCLFNAIDIGIAVALLTISYNHPHLIQGNMGQDVFADSLLQIMIIFLVTGISIAIYTYQYGKQHQKLLKLNAQLESLATTDELSGVFNKRKIVEILRNLCKEEQHWDIYVSMLDIDTFKNINDTFGHLVGDDAIRHVANHLTKTVGRYGYIGRYGGDEFLLVLYQRSENEIYDFANRLIQVPDFETITLSISAGITKKEKNESCEQLIEKADELLLLAKRNGRNNIRLWKEIEG